MLLAWIGAATWASAGPGAATKNVAFILALFACVVAHEFGHALMARRFGIRTPDITLLPIGGLARLERMPEKPAQEIAVAVAGPLVNVVIWAVLSLILGAGGAAFSLETLEDPGQGFFARLAAVNLLLVLFNMIPAFPMDGGRVLRAALAIPFGRERATNLAARAGQVIAILFGFWGLTGGNPLLVLIAVFIFMAAAAESTHTSMHSAARRHLAREAMITSFEALAPDDTLDAAAGALVRTTQAEFPVIGTDGHLRGILTRTAIMTGVQEGRRMQPVQTMMETAIPEVRLDAPLETALDAFARPDLPVAVTDRDGRFLGYITRENLGEWMIVSRRR